jgi:hypothetical protein
MMKSEVRALLTMHVLKDVAKDCANSLDKMVEKAREHNNNNDKTR